MDKVWYEPAYNSVLNFLTWFSQVKLATESVRRFIALILDISFPEWLHIKDSSWNKKYREWRLFYVQVLLKKIKNILKKFHS